MNFDYMYVWIHDETNEAGSLTITIIAHSVTLQLIQYHIHMVSCNLGAIPPPPAVVS